MEHRDALLVDYSIVKRPQYAWMVLSIDETIVKKQELIYCYLDHPGKKYFDNYIK